jgi:hypothetical protein
MYKCAMANSDFWRDFAVQFQALSSPHADVRGTWQHIVGSGVIGDWRLGGDDTLQIRFEALARRAASGLPIKRSPNLLVAWLEALREDGRNFRFWDSFPSGYVIGNIERLCEASANFCRKLESAALQAEFAEKQRNVVPSDSTPDAAAQAGNPPATPPMERRRMRATICCPGAARKMETYIQAKGIGLTDFASTVGTTDRTLRKFRQTGEIKRTILEQIAEAMGVTKDELLRS